MSAKADFRMLEEAWGIIANAGEGDWSTQTKKWQRAAEVWRDRYREQLKQGGCLARRDNRRKQ